MALLRVLWSPMTPTERTVGSRTAKAFPILRREFSANAIFLVGIPFLGYKDFKFVAAAGGDIHGVHQSSQTIHYYRYQYLYMEGRLQSNFSKVYLGLVVYVSS